MTVGPTSSGFVEYLLNITSLAGLEPKQLAEHAIYRLLDLAATEDDQHEVRPPSPRFLATRLISQPQVDKQSDFTMRAGGQRASLPLMRRFNEHSERLLNQSLGALAPSLKMDIDPGNAGVRRASACSWE